MAGQSRLLFFGLSATIGAVALGTAMWLKYREKLPTEWSKVGELSDIMCYPVKSCAPIRETEMECEELGLTKGWFLRDRVFMVTGLDYKWVTARDYPKMVLIQPECSDKSLVLKAPGMIDLIIPLENIHKQATKKAVIWGSEIQTTDCGEEAAKWLSRYILSDEVGFRLIYYPSVKCKTARPQLRPWRKFLSKDGGAMQDATSYMLITESSVADLNSRTNRNFTVQQFRPNFAIKGTIPYNEDEWDYVKIGETIFRNVKPCTRCIFTTIDPETGIKDSDSEPLKTLRGYRQLTDPELKKHEKHAPVLGIHLGLRKGGKVKLGDAVYINVKE